MLFVLRDSKETGDERKIKMAVEALRFYGNYEVILTSKLRLGPHLWYHLPLEAYLPRLVVFGGKRLAPVVAKQ